MKVHKKKLKSLKTDAVSESRQGALTASNANLAVANYTLDAVKENLAAVNLRGPDPLEHETLGYKRGSINHFEGRGERRRPETIFKERNT